jgi:multidrug efflux pump subunit AcrB
VPNIFHPRFRLILAAIILLAGGIVYEEKHRAATIPHITPPELAYSVPYDGAEFPATNENFSDRVNLWFNPAQEIHADDLTYATVILQSELGDEASAYDRVQTRVADGKINLPSVDITDKSVNYSIFTIGNFTASLHLTPVLANPQAIIPTEIKPGLGGSFDF